MFLKPRLFTGFVLLVVVGCANSAPTEPTNGQTTEKAKTSNPVKIVVRSVEKSYYSFLCSTLRIFPSSIGKLPLKSKTLKKRMLEVGVPRSCSNLILTATYGLKDINKLKRKLLEKNIPVVWVVGGPGSGKGTMCKEMVKKEGFTHISVGDSLRSEVKKDPDSIQGRIIQDVMTRGLLIPDIATLNFLSREMLDEIDKSKGFLIDGFPRSLGPAKLFQQKITPPDVIISLEVPDETLKARLLSRNEGRADDNEETIKKRLEVFHNQQKLVTENEKFKSKVKEINGEGSKEEVFNRFSEAIHEAIKQKTP